MEDLTWDLPVCGEVRLRWLCVSRQKGNRRKILSGIFYIGDQALLVLLEEHWREEVAPSIRLTSTDHYDPYLSSRYAGVPLYARESKPVAAPVLAFWAETLEEALTDNIGPLAAGLAAGDINPLMDEIATSPAPWDLVPTVDSLTATTMEIQAIRAHVPIPRQWVGRSTDWFRDSKGSPYTRWRARDGLLLFEKNELLKTFGYAGVSLSDLSDLDEDLCLIPSSRGKGMELVRWTPYEADVLEREVAYRRLETASSED